MTWINTIGSIRVIIIECDIETPLADTAQPTMPGKWLDRAGQDRCNSQRLAATFTMRHRAPVSPVSLKPDAP